ncbi:LamG-like jellyroll fold domain-containing protein [Pontibacter korlensis]|uniref:rhamnogalacturonan lyase family protein n=1 Tax=Pontibacter korlensis TaxID=400092 RepID=UPI0008FFADF6|nr:LamG-like jellyroll fold domain-containing protein [Pontibacter korlensis]
MKQFYQHTGSYTGTAQQQQGPSISGNQNQYRLLLLAVLALSLIVNAANAQKRYMEELNRGVVAVRKNANQVFISWRLLGTDPSDVAFNVYRGETKLNDEPLVLSTNFVDKSAASEATYHVRAVVQGQEQAPSEEAVVWQGAYMSLPLNRPAGGTVNGSSYTYSPNDMSVGDLDGDGEYELIVKWDPSNSRDNSQKGYTGKVFLDAYKLSGEHLWRIDLGWNIRAGAHYTQFLVYDFDSDGKAEVVCKTADGTVDGTGVVIGDASADYRNSDGYILAGPEFLTVFNGETGGAMATVDYLPGRGNVSSWGDSYGNRVDRFLAGVGYFDGERPSILMARGYYTRSVLVAWDWRNGQLSQRWTFDTNDPEYSAYAGQGNHSLSIADVDSDGKDEVVYGAMAVDHDGTGLYSTGHKHGDAQHVSDLDPDRPGLEVYSIHETPATPGASLWDARTGEVLWKTANADVGRGLAADITAAHRGFEAWGFGGVRNIKGEVIATSNPASTNFAIWWDGDLLRELLNENRIDKYGVGRLLTATGASSNNSTKATPNLQADLFGDWREEFIVREDNNESLRIYTTTFPTNYRLYTLMHNPQYRVAIAWQNVGYNQPPHVSYYLGDNMNLPLQPEVRLAGTSTVPDNTNSLTPPSHMMAQDLTFSSVRLSWQDNAEGETAILLLRSEDDSSYTELATLAANTTFYEDKSVEPDTRYFYRLRTLQGEALSAFSMPFALATPAIPTKPEVPYNPAPADAVTYEGTDKLTLRWAGSDNTDTYKVYFGTNPAKLAFKGDAAAASFSVANLADNTTYYWRVDAENEVGLTTGAVWSFNTATLNQTGIRGDWRFDEASGIGVQDHSKYGNHGELKNTDGSIWTRGKFNRALDLTGTTALNSHVQVPHQDQLYFDDNSFSVSLWIKTPARSPQSYYIFHKGTFSQNDATGATGQWFGLEVKDALIRFAVDDNITKTEVGANNATFLTDEWVHVVVIRDRESKKLRLYRNGALVSEASDNTSAGIGQTESLVIGNNSNYNGPYRGMLDELKVYNYSLSEEEISALYRDSRLISKATNPTPADLATAVAPEAVELGWQGDAPAYNLYLGTAADALQLKAAGLTQSAYVLENLSHGTGYFWRVDAVDGGDVVEGDVWRFTTAATSDLEEQTKAGMFYAYPNPFSDQLHVELQLKDQDQVSIAIYDQVSGQKLHTLVSETLEAGLHRLQWNATDARFASLEPGVYFCVLQTSTYKMVRRIVKQ